MKYFITIFLAMFFLLSCSDDEPEESLELKIERLKSEINLLIDASTAESSDDCRTYLIPGGNGCGPIYIYGVKGIDSTHLQNLFNELSKAQTELFERNGGPVCSLIFPVKDSLINGECLGCYNEEDELNCYKLE